MSNGDPPPVSGSSYIIICSGRIDVAAANGTEGKIVAAARCAALFAAHIRAGYGEESEASMVPLSAIQHYLMDNLKQMNRQQAEAKIAELFNVMTAIEHAY